MNSGFEIAGGMIKKYHGTETALVIPDGVTGIGFEAFAECENLRSVIIPDTVTEIGGKAFFGCTGLTSISIPDHVKKSVHMRSAAAAAFHQSVSLMA